MTVPVSVLIPTKNEEKNILKCLESVSWADQVFVVDSHSTDRTADIATRQGATVVAFSWDGKGPRKFNWALEHLPWRNEWVLVVDADEEVTASLQTEIAALVSKPSEHAGYLIPYHYYFLGRLLRHGARLWKLILFKHQLARFERIDTPEFTTHDLELHAHPLVHGSVGKLRGPMIHRDFEDLHHHFQRHNIYSDWEVLLRTRYRDRQLDREIQPRFFGSPLERRRFLKRLFLALPGKPWIYFFYSYILQGGFLDGRPGFIYNVLKAFYWYQISIKEYEVHLRDPSKL